MQNINKLNNNKYYGKNKILQFTIHGTMQKNGVLDLVRISLEKA
jgi:hypothetical protein